MKKNCIEIVSRYKNMNARLNRGKNKNLFDDYKIK